MKRVLLAMSGGVDSSACAVLLQEQGYEVVGVTMLLWHDYEQELRQQALAEKATLLAQKLGLRHYVLDLSQEFYAEVVTPFIAAYQQGQTPNPCILCNRKFKFSLLWARAEAHLRRDLELAATEEAFAYYATGHYALLRSNSQTGEVELHCAQSAVKDQAYMLYSLSQKQLQRLLLPLGNLSKSEVRQIAQRAGLDIKPTEESQDICFISTNYKDLLQRHGGFGPAGNFVNPTGAVLGQHSGLANFTVGQRKGLGQSFGKRMSVLELKPKTAEVVLGDETALYRPALRLNELSFNTALSPHLPLTLSYATRYQQKPKPCTIQQDPLHPAQLILTSAEPQRAACPGQTAVFYAGSRVLGGGTIAPFTEVPYA